MKNKTLGYQARDIRERGCRCGTFLRPRMLPFSSTMRRKLLITLCFELLAAPVVSSQVSSGSAASPASSISLPGSQNPFTGSEPEGKAWSEILELDIKDAIDRGLRNNLGLLIAGDNTITARGERWKELSDLLPNLEARAEESVQTQSLTALGLKPSVFHAPVPRVIGPFNYFDVRAYLSQSLFDLNATAKERPATQSLKAAQDSNKNAGHLYVVPV